MATQLWVWVWIGIDWIKGYCWASAEVCGLLSAVLYLMTEISFANRDESSLQVQTFSYLLWRQCTRRWRIHSVGLPSGSLPSRDPRSKRRRFQHQPHACTRWIRLHRKRISPIQTINASSNAHCRFRNDNTLYRCAVIQFRTCNREVAGSNLGRDYFAARSTQPSIPPWSVNEYQLRLERQRQVWLIPLADETQGVHVKLCYPLTMRAIPERLMY